jgi:hypothetical protein
VVGPLSNSHPIHVRSASAARELSHLLPPGALGSADGSLTINGRKVCLYEYGDQSVRYFSPSLNGVEFAYAEDDSWADFVHREDRDWLLDLHESAVTSGSGYEAMFRYVLPDGDPVWVVDRQEPTNEVDSARWSGISLDVTDLVTLDHPSTGTSTVIKLQVLCLPDPVNRRRPASEISSVPETASAFPVGEQAWRLWAKLLPERPTGSIVVTPEPVDSAEPTYLICWTPLEVDSPQQMWAMAIADLTDHLSANHARRVQLREIARMSGAAEFRLSPGGRARVAREWLARVSSEIVSYSDLLDLARPSEVHRLRSKRRVAMQTGEGYCIVLHCMLDGAERRVVEVGMPDANADQWDCLLFVLRDDEDPGLLRQVRELAERSSRDAEAQLLHGLMRKQTQQRLMQLLVRLSGHETHVRRKLKILEGWGDRALLPRQFSHPLRDNLVARPRNDA